MFHSNIKWGDWAGEWLTGWSTCSVDRRTCVTLCHPSCSTGEVQQPNPGQLLSQPHFEPVVFVSEHKRTLMMPKEWHQGFPLAFTGMCTHLHAHLCQHTTTTTLESHPHSHTQQQWLWNPTQTWILSLFSCDCLSVYSLINRYTNENIDSNKFTTHLRSRLYTMIKYKICISTKKATRGY